MEKRFFLAIVLSFCILYLWSFFAPKPQEPLLSRSAETSQVIDSNKVINISEDIPKGSKEPFTAPLSSSSSQEETFTLESEKLKVVFSNIGGTISSINIKNFDAVLPLTDIYNLSNYNNVVYTKENASQNTISFVYEDSSHKITKTYTLSKDDYIIRSEILLEKNSDMSNVNRYVIDGFTLNMSNLDFKKDPTASRDKALLEYVINTESGIQRKAKAFKFSKKDIKSGEEKINWIGFRDRYFCAILYPDFDTTGFSTQKISDEILKIRMNSSEIQDSAQQSIKLSSVLYAGPENLDILKQYGLNFEKIRRYYSWGLFDAIAKLIYGIMRLVHKVIPSWGLCIIIMSLLIYFSMYPLTLRSMLSMKKMQSLQPRIKYIQDKYKSNPQKMNKEIMDLYKENRVNPLGGCLPMFFQTPVFIGLYQVLWRSVSFKGAHFLWIKDLSAADRLVIFPFHLPVIGNEFNILPVLMMVVMFFQQKLTAKNMPVADPNQATQQKMMGTILPLFLGFIFYKFPSGLTLYFLMFYILSTFTQWKMSAKTQEVVKNERTG